MTSIIIIFGGMTMLAGIILMINPDYIFGIIRKHYEKLGMHIVAVVVRIGLGLLFILQSGDSKFPQVIEIIGWLSLTAAVFFTLIGRQNFNKIISWALSLANPVGRIGGLGAVAFGAFLIYAFV